MDIISELLKVLGARFFGSFLLDKFFSLQSLLQSCILEGFWLNGINKKGSNKLVIREEVGKLRGIGKSISSLAVL